MGTKRKPLRRETRRRITSEAIEAWRACMEFVERHGDTSAAREESWVADSEGHNSTNPFIEAKQRLDRALGLRPWEESPVNTESETPPDWMRDPRQIEDWRHAWELRCDILEAVKQ